MKSAWLSGVPLLLMRTKTSETSSFRDIGRQFQGCEGKGQQRLQLCDGVLHPFDLVFGDLPYGLQSFEVFLGHLEDVGSIAPNTRDVRDERHVPLNGHIMNLETLLKRIEGDSDLLAVVVVPDHWHSLDDRIKGCEPLLTVHDHQAGRLLLGICPDRPVTAEAVPPHQ